MVSDFFFQFRTNLAMDGLQILAVAMTDVV